jgi:glycosyltransferase involved in cell wall biosynthesis
VKVSVITPTWQRHDLLLDRCIPSVVAQDFDGEVEHIVISDGPDPALRDRVCGLPVRYEEVTEHTTAQPNFGSHLRNLALGIVSGDFVAYLDDDNAYRPEHVRLLVDAIVSKGAEFAYSRMQRHGQVNGIIGAEPPMAGHIDTSLLMHRASLATHWPGPDNPLCDWLTVKTWLDQAAPWAHVPEVTVDYYWRGGS